MKIKALPVAVLAAAASCGAGGRSQDAFDALVNGRAALPAPIADACRLAADRCTRCHAIDRVLVARVESPPHWRYYVDRMRRQPGSGISEDDAETITTCLVYRTFGGTR